MKSEFEIKPGPFNSTYQKSTTIIIAPTTKSQSDELLEKYEGEFKNFTQGFNWIIQKDRLGQTSFIFYNKIVPTLNAHPTSVIQEFLYRTQAFEAQEPYSTFTGLFLTALMMRLRKAGYHKFYFDLRGLKPLHHLNYCARERERYHLQGLEVMIEGRVGNYFAQATTGGTFYVEEAGDYVGTESTGATIYLKNAGKYVGNKHITVNTPNSSLAKRFYSSEYDNTHLMTQEQWDTNWQRVKQEIQRMQP